MNARLRLSSDGPCADLAGAYVFFRVGFVRHMNSVARLIRHSRTRLAAVAFIQTQMLLGRGGVGPRDRYSVQRRLQQSAIGGIRATDHEAQRHALFIHQQTPLGAQFAAIGRIFPGLFAAQWRFGHRPIRRLPLPRQAFEFVVLGESGLPHPPEDTRAYPLLKIPMSGFARAQFLRQRVPLTAGAQDVQDARHHRAPIRGGAAPNMFPVLSATAITRLRRWQQRLNSLPETIRQFPAGDVRVLCLRLFRCVSHAYILLPEQVLR
jgi:hypothetical protein